MPSGQSNFFLHPIPGEEAVSLKPSNNYTIVTDLPIEQFNGHPVVIYGFVSPKSNYGLCFAYSRSTNAWIMIHDLMRLNYLFDTGNEGTKVAGTLLQAFTGIRMAVSPVNGKTGKPMSNQELHQLMMAIRQYLSWAINQPQDQGSARL